MACFPPHSACSIHQHSFAHSACAPCCTLPPTIQVGFLTLLEALHLCKAGQHLKRPSCPIWVLGSESHYTVLFALSRDVQAESDVEEEERRVREAFDR